MKLRLTLKSFQKEAISQACDDLHSLCSTPDAIPSGWIALPTQVKKYCVLRSPQRHKDSREHFEVRLHKRFFDIQTDSVSLVNTLLKVELPSGVTCSLKVLQP